MIKQFVLWSVIAALPAAGQTTTRRGYISAYGEGTVAVRPDSAKVNLGVVTQAQTANDAATRNADLAAAVIAALRSVLGASAEIHTASYSLGPTYNYPPGGGQATVTGFSATNVLQATVNDLAITGRVIDAGIQAGANRVDGIRLTLRDEEPARAQALRLAAQKAKQKVETIASGLGVRTGAVVSAAEGYQVIQPLAERSPAAAIAQTPIEAGTMDVRATVTLQVEVQ